MSNAKIFALTKTGYDKLFLLAKTNPELFKVSNSSELMDELKKLKDDSSAAHLNIFNQKRRWIPQIPLDEITDTAVSGPTMDEAHSRWLREAVVNMTVADMSDKRVLASINCFHLLKYVQVRWESSNLSKAEKNEDLSEAEKKEEMSKFVIKHWLGNSKESNAVARIWWLGEFADKAARYSEHDREFLLEKMANNATFYNQFLRRTFIYSDKIRAAILDVAIETGLADRNTTSETNATLRQLNRVGGSISLDVLRVEILREKVREALPPK